MLEYRPEIDGMRAVAVVPVILFHAGVGIFSGGFIGVDIFFVISGYLITSILISELSAQEYSILKFYERRARRILPALLFIFISVTPFAWFWLMPSDLEEYFESLMAATIFLSNFYFWDQSGYFDSSAELKPLLHTWSLAVEEQYYIIFPLILSFIWRFGRRVMLWSVWLLLIFSILIAQYQVNTSQVSAFFLLPSRGWELLAGALVATANFNGKERFSRWTRELYAVAGFVMISVCMILYDQDTDFPGSRAVPVVFGTVLIILFATKDQIVGRILSKKPLVAIGLISYSLYLWHQPIFALFKYRFGYDKFDIFMCSNSDLI